MNLNEPDRAEAELTEAVATGDSETIARVAMHNVWPLLSSHAALLITVISALPTSIVERYPALKIVHPMTAVQARVARPFRPQLYTETARSMSPEEIDFLILAQLISFRASGDVAGSLLYARRLSERIQEVRIESRDRLDGPLWYFHHQIGSTYLLAGDSGRALLEFATARQLGKLSAQIDAERIALGRIALCHALRGAVSDAERTLVEARALPPPTPAHVMSSVSTECTAAALIAADMMADDLDELLGELPPYDSIELTWPFVLLARARVFLARGLPEEALEAVRLTRDSHAVQPGSYAFDIIGAMSVSALTAMGDWGAAQRAAQEYSGRGGTMVRLAVVRLSLLENKLTQAKRQLRALAQDERLGPSSQAEIILLSGWLELVDTADLHRETAMRIQRVVRNRERRRLIGMLPRQLVDRVQELLPEDVAVEFDGYTRGQVHLEIRERPALTPSELRVLHALVDHRSVATIATEFAVSRNTIKSQLRSLYKKLDSSTREDALRAAAQLHLLESSTVD